MSSISYRFATTDLVELEVVEQVVELPVLLLLLQLEVILLQTVQSELGLVIDVDFKRLNLSNPAPELQPPTHVLHELLAGRADVLGEGGGKHHDLLVVRGRAEDLLDIATHVCGRNDV